MSGRKHINSKINLSTQKTKHCQAETQKPFFSVVFFQFDITGRDKKTINPAVYIIMFNKMSSETATLLFTKNTLRIRMPRTVLSLDLFIVYCIFLW